MTSKQELCSLGEGEANLTREIHKVVYLDAVRDSFFIHTPTGTRGERHDLFNIYLCTQYGSLYIQSTYNNLDHYVGIIIANYLQMCMVEELEKFSVLQLLATICIATSAWQC